MITVAPAFWVRYRGVVDPNRPFATNYVYAVTLLAPNNVVLLSASRTVVGPPQLNKNNFMEINWTVPPGLTRVIMNRGGNAIWQSNGASGGFRDEGQFLVNYGGSINQ